MPLEIRELTIKVEIRQQQQTPDLAIPLQQLKEQVVNECLKKLKYTLEKSSSR